MTLTYADALREVVDSQIALDHAMTLVPTDVLVRLLADVDQLALVREYVQRNRDVWAQDHEPQGRADLLAIAYADIYQKVLNVIDTGDPLRPAP